MATFLRTESVFLRLTVFSAVLLSALAGALTVGAQTPSTALLVLEKDDEQMAIVDPASLKVVGRVPSGSAPHEIIASEDGKFAYISNYASQRGMFKTIS